MQRSVLIFLSILCFSSYGNAQKTGRGLVDSLIQSLSSVSNDTVKTRTYNRIFNELSVLDVSQARQYAQAGLTLAQKMKWPKGIAVFQHNIGQSFSSAGQYDSAKYYYELALSAHDLAGDRYNMAITYNNLGAAAQNIRADYTTAADYYFRALQQAEALNDSTLLALTLSNVSNIFSLQKNYPKALDYGRRALKICEVSGTPDEVANSLHGLGKTYYASGDTVSAKDHFQKALMIYERTGNMTGLASTWSGLSLVYGNDLRRVLEARLRSKKLWDETNPLHPEAITNLGNLGIVYLDIVRYDTLHLIKRDDLVPGKRPLLLKKSTEYLQAAIQLAEQTGDLDNRSFFVGALAELQEFTGDYKNAFYNYRLSKEIQDSIYSQEVKNKIAEANSRREIDQKNAELRINQLALHNQRKTLWGLAAGLFLVGVIGILLYRQNQSRKKTNRQLLTLNKELDDANRVRSRLFGILSHDLRAPVARLINFLHLRRNQPAMFSEEQAASHEAELTNSAEGLLENMETVLLWSKSQLERLQPQPVKLFPADLFQHLQKQFYYVGKAVLLFNSNDNAALIADEHCARTILYNLTTNSLKAVENIPNPQIYWKSEHRNKEIVLSITDNGGGLDPDLLTKEGERRSGADARTGLGLSIVRDLATIAGCKVSLLTTGPHGTTIELVFQSS